jgi:hypothetical protein
MPRKRKMKEDNDMENQENNTQTTEFTTQDFIDMIKALQQESGEDHPLATDLMKILLAHCNDDDKSEPLTPEAIDAVKQALEQYDIDGNRDTTDDTDNIDDEALNDTSLGDKDNSLDEFDENENHELSDNEKIFNELNDILNETGKITKGNINNLCDEYGLEYPDVYEIAIEVINDKKLEMNENKEPVIDPEDDSVEDRIYDFLKNYYEENPDSYLAGIYHASDEFDCSLDEVEDIAKEVKADMKNMSETTGAASSGSFNGKLMGRPNTPEDEIFEGDEQDGIHTNFICTVKENKIKILDFSDTEEEGKQKMKMLAGNQPCFIQTYVQLKDQGIDPQEEGNWLVMPKADSEKDLQEEYVKPKNAQTLLKKVHNETAKMSKEDRKNNGLNIKQGDKEDGVQFVTEVPEGEKPSSEFTKRDNTPVQKQVRLIRKGMEDLEYDLEPSQMWKKQFEQGINPKTKSEKFTNQFGVEVPEMEHGNFIKSDVGEKILSDVAKKKEIYNKTPKMDNFIQRTTIVKDYDKDEVIKEDTDVIITKGEKKLIEEEVNKMKNLIKYNTKDYLDTTKNIVDKNEIFKTLKAK